MRHLTKAHVRWDDLDGFGHVNNATYLTYIQEARADFTWYSRKSVGREPMLADMVVGRAEVDFIVPIYEGGFDLDVAIIAAAKERIVQRKLDCSTKHDEIVRFLVTSLKQEQRYREIYFPRSGFWRF